MWTNADRQTVLRFGRPLRQGVLSAAICLAGTGCVSLADVAVNRASREFVCPADRIGILARSDISMNLYDLEACGHRARYSCLESENLPATCVREPDPPKWDPDPKAVASMPQPARFDFISGVSHGKYRRICADRADFEGSGSCLLR